MTLTPFLLHWFHATNNSFSIIQFIAHHKCNSKANAVANEHGRCFWLQQLPGCQRKERMYILQLHHIPIKTRKLHFQVCGINIIYRVKRQMAEGNSQVATLCNGTTAASANEEIHPKPSEARLDLLIHIYVHLSCAYSHTCSCGQSDPGCTRGHISLIIYCSRQNTEKWYVWMHLRHQHRNELPFYLFIQAFLSITTIIRTNSFKFWENEGCIPSNFQFGSGNYGHDECLNSPSSSSHFS